LCFIQYASEFFELGEARTGVYNLLVTHVCSMWQKRFLESGPEAVLHSLETHQELIMQACLFGPVHKKNLRLVRLSPGQHIFVSGVACFCFTFFL